MQENNNSKNHIIIQKKTKKYVEVCYNMEIIDAKTLDYKAINEALRRSDDACTIQNCCGQRFLASGMSQKDLTIYGIPGNALGAYLNNAAITVYGLSLIHISRILQAKMPVFQYKSPSSFSSEYFRYFSLL